MNSSKHSTEIAIPLSFSYWTTINEDSEIPYDGPLSSKNFDRTTARLFFSLQTLFVFTLCFLILFCLESFLVSINFQILSNLNMYNFLLQWIYCIQYPSYYDKTRLILTLLHCVVILNIIHLIARVWYRGKVKRTAYPGYYIRNK